MYCLPTTGLRFIEELYEIERRVKEASVDERLRARQAQSLAIVAKLRDWLDGALGTVVPQSLTGKALGYLDGQWPKLVRVFETGHVPMDTNVVLELKPIKWISYDGMKLGAAIATDGLDG